MHYPDTFNSHSYAHKIAESLCDIHAINDATMIFRPSRGETRAGVTIRTGADTWFHIYDHDGSTVVYRITRAVSANTAATTIAKGEFDTAYVPITQCAMACANIIRAVQV